MRPCSLGLTTPTTSVAERSGKHLVVSERNARRQDQRAAEVAAFVGGENADRKIPLRSASKHDLPRDVSTRLSVRGYGATHRQRCSAPRFGPVQAHAQERW